jgi:hypothetical protein
VDKEFSVKGFRRLTMPANASKCMFEISIKCLDVPSHMIEMGKFQGGIEIRVLKGRHQPSASETFPVNIKHPDCESGVTV